MGTTQTSITGKRTAAFAGQWYEADADKLSQQLKGFLETARVNLEKAQKEKRSVFALIVPHAGYLFSGQTAAYGYVKGLERKPKRIFLLGPSHYAGFQGVALSADHAFATPLGDLEVDTAVVEELNEYPLFKKLPEVHRIEHSLELQLPLIKEALPDVKIVPIIIGTLVDDTQVRLVGQIIKQYLTEDDLVVVSSDFTHFGPRYQYEPFHENVPENIKKLDEEAFQHLQQRNLEGFIMYRNRTKNTICGFFPCAVLLAMLPTDMQCTLLDYKTSRDTRFEDSKNSVSYLAIEFSKPSTARTTWNSENSSADYSLTRSEGETLLRVARRTLEVYLATNKIPSLEELGVKNSGIFNEPLGLFCTLLKRSTLPQTESAQNHIRELRGCIGYIWPVKPLLFAVIDNAISAATRDGRFKHVTLEELPQLQIELNILTPLRRVKSSDDIELGKHGIVLYKNGRQAVFLPSVPIEFGWNMEQTLCQLSAKAGCGLDGWRSGAKYDVFESQIFMES
jgi:AmmeMemoRadiSam system protein B/uncharacterized protein (TIGR00296 family)